MGSLVKMEKRAALLLLVSLFLGAHGEQDCQGSLCLTKDFELTLWMKGNSNGLSYKRGTKVYSSASDVLGACMPNVEPEITPLAKNSECSGSMGRVCTLAKRKWLMNNDNKETVANTDLILSSVAALEGGESIVNECLQIPEEYEEYEYHDYAYYDDIYDYLEETDNSRRVRRDAGKKKQKKTKKNGGGERKRKRTRRKGKCDNKKRGCKGRRGGKRT